MFHVEQKETHIEVVDHFLTKETFTIKKTPIKGLLKTHPAPSKNKIQLLLRPHPNDYLIFPELVSINCQKK